MNEDRFKRLVTGAKQALDHAQGKRRDLRTTVLPKPPKELSAKEITNIRLKLNVSQGVFARYLNISPKTVQSWEQGIGRPSGASLKLLTIVQRDPTVILEPTSQVKHKSQPINRR